VPRATRFDTTTRFTKVPSVGPIVNGRSSIWFRVTLSTK
jgi:hypothetical protein